MRNITVNLLDYFWKTGIKPIKNRIEELKEVAFSGKYSDLTDRPSALKNPNALTFTGAVTESYDGSANKSVKIPSVTNNLLATQQGTALDAVQGKALDDKISQIYSNLANLPIAFIRSDVHLAAQGVTKITITHNIGLNKQYGVWITPYFANVHPGTTWSERFISCVKNYAVSNLQANSFDIDFFLTEQTDIYAELICLVYTY